MGAAGVTGTHGVCVGWGTLQGRGDVEVQVQLPVKVFVTLWHSSHSRAGTLALPQDAFLRHQW